ncbi:MAG: hypothetical protein IKI42_09350 [Clostridia bacterium]|nr:hypothetical protein [Clostridia bacterium]
MDNFSVSVCFIPLKQTFLKFDLDIFKGFLHFYTIRKARQSKMSESRGVKMVILDKFRSFLVILIPEEPAKNERECGAAGKIRPRIRSEGAADLIERVITAADQAKRSGRPHRACNHGRGSGKKERPTSSGDPRQPRQAEARAAASEKGSDQ